MKNLFKELIGYMGDVTIILYVGLLAIVLAVAAHFLLRKYSKYIKYLPGIVLIVLGFINLISVRNSLVEIESLDRILSFVTYVVGGFVGIFTALLLSVYDKPKKNKELQSRRGRRRRVREKTKEINEEEKA